MWRAYKAAAASFWTADTVADLGCDVEQWNIVLHRDERMLLLRVLVASAVSRTFVADDVQWRFCGQLPNTEARSFYALQGVM